jgi:NAD+ diphosphatase
MIGFTARYVSGEVRVDGVEIEDAGWYTRNHLPGLPGQLSIAHALIGDFLSQP